MAFGMSSRRTRFGSSDWYAGPPNAWAVPVMHDSARMCQTLHGVPVDEGGQREGRAHLHALRDQQHRPAIAAVGDHAADEREEQDRQLAEERVEAEVERRVRQREHEPALGDLLHPRADAGREGADPQHAEVAVGERARHAPEDGVDGHGLSILVWGSGFGIRDSARLRQTACRPATARLAGDWYSVRSWPPLPPRPDGSCVHRVVAVRVEPKPAAGARVAAALGFRHALDELHEPAVGLVPPPHHLGE